MVLKITSIINILVVAQMHKDFILCHQDKFVYKDIK
jgi:hypothetical protein